MNGLHFLIGLTCFILVIVIIVDFLRNKKQECLFDSLISAGITLILSTIPSVVDFIISIITEILTINIQDELPPYPVCVGVGIFLIAIGLITKFILKNKILVLNMLGLFSQIEISEDKHIKQLRLSEFSIKEQIIDLTSFWNNLNDNKKLMNKSICQYIESATQRFVARSTDQRSTCFTGMAPIPYTIYAGTFLENAKIARYFEYDAQNHGKYYELKKKRCVHSWDELRINFPENINEKATEVLVTISVSHKINKTDIQQFDMDVISVSLTNPKDNVIKNIHQLKEYKGVIYNCLEKDIKTQYPNIQKIHIAASIPSCLSLEIGRSIGIRANRMCDIIVYHYIRTVSPRYVFGLIVNGTNKGSTYEKDEQHV